MAFPLQSTPFARHCGDPYPNITLHNTEDSLRQACLILSPAGQDSLHLTLTFPEYPLRAPAVTIQSDIHHPNVFGTYICASIVNMIEGYAPVYTLKSIAIQLLSFFSSETLEQDYGGDTGLGWGILRARALCQRRRILLSPPGSRHASFGLRGVGMAEHCPILFFMSGGGLDGDGPELDGLFEDF